MFRIAFGVATFFIFINVFASMNDYVEKCFYSEPKTVATREDLQIHYSQVVADGEILERRTLPPYLIIQNDTYRYQFKFLINKVFKGPPALVGKIITFDAYMEQRLFSWYVPGKKMILSFAEVSNNLNGTLFHYALGLAEVRVAECYFKMLNFNNLKFLPIEEYFHLDAVQIYYSDEIILGYKVGETIIPRKGERAKDGLKRHYDEKPDYYIVRDFFVKRVLKGNKYFEGKIVKFVDYPWSKLGVSGYSFVKIKKQSPTSIVPGKLLLLSLKDIKMIDKNSDENYTGPYAYDEIETRVSELDPSKEFAIKLYFKSAGSPSFVVPPKPTPFVPYAW